MTKAPSRRRSPGPIAAITDRSRARPRRWFTRSALNHGFVDGNKRTAIFMMELLLKRSGYALRPIAGSLEDEVEAMVLAVVEHHLSFTQLGAWFETRIVRRRR
jgi:prophage maintenance system killer protein